MILIQNIWDVRTAVVEVGAAAVIAENSHVGGMMKTISPVLGVEALAR